MKFKVGDVIHWVDYAEYVAYEILEIDKNIAKIKQLNDGPIWPANSVHTAIIEGTELYKLFMLKKQFDSEMEEIINE